MNLDHYRVKPDQTPRLDAWTTAEDGGLSKQQGLDLFMGLQDQLAELQERLYAVNMQALLIVLQARDTGGKDGTVKKVIGSFNPNGVRIANFKVPTQEERAHDFLWRIHAQVPRSGMIGVFNRSHYEDVLVTRVHGLIDTEAARQRLKHIRHFEALLTDAGTSIVKLYLHLGRDEQKKRLQARLDDPSKHWKFNPGDLEERAHWDAYTRAYEDALSTSTPEAPWYVIPADHKWFRNLLIAQILVHSLQQMAPQYPAPTFDPSTFEIP